MEFLRRIFRKQSKRSASKLIVLRFTDPEQFDQAIIIAADKGIPADVPSTHSLIIRKKHKKYFKRLRFEIQNALASWNLTPEDERGFKTLHLERMKYYKGLQEVRRQNQRFERLFR